MAPGPAHPSQFAPPTPIPCFFMVNPSPEIWPAVETELGRETPDLTHKSDLKDKGGADLPPPALSAPLML